MRKMIAKIVAYVGLVGSFTVAGLWTYWIWQLEWGGLNTWSGADVPGDDVWGIDFLHRGLFFSPLGG
jgi:hypothetical protein